LKEVLRKALHEQFESFATRAIDSKVDGIRKCYALCKADDTVNFLSGEGYPKCPSGSEQVGIYCTRPDGIVELIPADLSTSVRRNIPVCVGSVTGKSEEKVDVGVRCDHTNNKEVAEKADLTDLQMVLDLAFLITRGKEEWEFVRKKRELLDLVNKLIKSGVFFRLERSDPNYAYSISVDAILKEYGIDINTYKSMNMGLLMNEKASFPENYKIYVEDPFELRDFIDRWDIFFSSNMEMKAARIWNDWLALREYIQNALDAIDRVITDEERKKFYEKMEYPIKFYVDELGTHIVDYGPGIKPEHFLIGGTDKLPWERGFYGEGMKMAAVFFLSKGYPSYFFTRNMNVYKAVNIRNIMHVVIGKHKKPIDGTEVIINGYSAEMPSRGLVFTFLKENKVPYYIKWTKGSFIVGGKGVESPEEPNIVIDYPNLLWVRDIFVNEIRELTGDDSLFSYDLWWVELHRDRVSLTGREIYYEIPKIFPKELVGKMLDEMIDVERGSVNIYFESDLYWENTGNDVKEEARKYLEERGLTYTLKPIKMVDSIRHFIEKKVISIEYAPKLQYLFELVPSAEALTRAEAKRIREVRVKGKVPEEALTLDERCVFRYAVEIMKHVCGELNWRMEEVVEVIEGLKSPGATNPGEPIMIDRGALNLINKTRAVDTVLHEFAHHYAALTQEEHRDVTEGFEIALSRVAGVAGDIAGYSDDERLTLERILQGGFGATIAKWNEEEGKYFSSAKNLIIILQNSYDVVRFGYVADKINEQIELYTDWINSGNLAIVVIGFHKTKSGDWRVKVYHTVKVRDIIPGDIPPRRDVYEKTMMDKIEKFEKEIIKELKQYERAGYIIWWYDPWEDTYKLYKQEEITGEVSE
jgi:hypothetical protein